MNMSNFFKMKPWCKKIKVVVSLIFLDGLNMTLETNKTMLETVILKTKIKSNIKTENKLRRSFSV